MKRNSAYDLENDRALQPQTQEQYSNFVSLISYLPTSYINPDPPIEIDFSQYINTHVCPYKRSL